jgi:hypothetical protein
MKRRTFRQLRAKGQPGQHHNVYVMLLNPLVGKLRKVRAENPKRNPKKPCVYVGMTGLKPEERFANHKAGIKSGIGGETLRRPVAAGTLRAPKPDAIRGGGADGNGFGGRFAPGRIHGHGRSLTESGCCPRLFKTFTKWRFLVLKQV